MEERASKCPSGQRLRPKCAHICCTGDLRNDRRKCLTEHIVLGRSLRSYKQRHKEGAKCKLEAL
eukprot:1147222-Pelagomonas_calceolata.AAC.6